MAYYVYHCDRCGSPRIQIQEWRNPNTGEWCGDNESSEAFCNRCDTETRYSILEVNLLEPALLAAAEWSRVYHDAS